MKNRRAAFALGLIVAALCAHLGPEAWVRYTEKPDMVVEYTSPMEGHYTGKACVLYCFDCRFEEQRARFEEVIGWTGQFDADRLIHPGGAMDLASANPIRPSARGLVRLQDIGISLKLHHGMEVILTIHQGCGMYGDTMPKEDKKAFVFIERELRRARNTARRNGIGCRIRTWAIMSNRAEEVDPEVNPPAYAVQAKLVH